MRRNASAICLATLLLAAALSAGSARAADENLDKAWQLALANDPALAAVHEELESARAAERAARAQRLPSVALTSNYVQFADAPALSVVTPVLAFQSPRLFDNDNFWNRGAELRLPLFAGGSITAGIRAAGSSRRAAEAQHLRALADLKLDVAEKYIGVLRTRGSLEAATAQVAALHAHVQDVDALVEQGAVNRSDLLASKVALANAEQQRLREVSAAAQARAAYNRRLGQPLEREPDLAAAIPEPEAPDEQTLAALQSLALGRRAELQALDARAESLGQQARAEAGRQWPQLGLSAAYQHLESTVLDRQEFSMVGLGLTWQLFDGGQIRQRAASLRRASRAASLQREDLAAAIQVEVQQAWLGVNEAQARLAATREAVALADENLRMSREQYAAELIPNTQVLEAVALQLSAAANARDAVLDAAVSRLRLARALGTL